MICGKKRLDEYDPNNDLPPATGAQPFKKRRVASQAVDSYCEENGLKKDSKDDHRRGPFPLVVTILKPMWTSWTYGSYNARLGSMLPEPSARTTYPSTGENGPGN